MSIWQQLRRTITESAGAGVKVIPTEYRCRQSWSSFELYCGHCLQDQQKVRIFRSHDQCATVLRTVGGRVQIWQFSVLRNRGQNAASRLRCCSAVSVFGGHARAMAETKGVCRRSMSDGFRATAIVIVSGPLERGRTPPCGLLYSPLRPSVSRPVEFL